MERMKKIGIFLCLISIVLSGFGQGNSISEAVSELDKGCYVILEVRMQLEDEFQTVEGNESANLSRVALFTGKNAGKEILSKGFSGFNKVVDYLNEMKAAGFNLEESYPMKGNSLMITHYVFKKVKK